MERATRHGRIHSRERGQDLIEYSLIIALVAIVMIGIVGAFGQRVGAVYCAVIAKIDRSALRDSVCTAPIATCEASFNGSTVQMEANIIDPDAPEGAPYSQIDRVEFHDNGTLVNTERIPRYCLRGGDSACQHYVVSSGAHTIMATVYDRDGNQGMCSIEVTR